MVFVLELFFLKNIDQERGITLFILEGDGIDVLFDKGGFDKLLNFRT